MISLKRFISIITSMLVMAILAVIFFPMMTGSKDVDPNLLNEVVEVVYTDLEGNTTQVTGTNVPTPQKGETFDITVPLDTVNQVSNADLCLMFYHCTVEVTYGDRVLYSYGQELAEKGGFIGSVYVIAPIPDEAWGDSLTIHLVATESGSEIGLDDITICRGEKSYLYYVAGNEVLFACFFTVIILAIIFIVTLLFSGRLKQSQVRMGIYACSFALLLSMWVFGYYGLNRLMISSEKICADMEYILLYFAPAPVCMYMYELERTKKEKYIYLGMAGTYILAGIVLSILNYTNIVHFSKTLTIFHVLLAIGCVYTIVSIYRDRRANNIGKVITKYGLTVLVLSAFLDLLRFSVKHYTMADWDFLYVSVVPFGIIIFIATMVYGFIQSLLAGEVNRQERERLTTMAYTDSMTGLSNRAEYNRVIDELREKGTLDYAIIFFDLNFLKKTNDLYGHNMGDAYIKEVALTLRKTFGKDAFCGRLGGDEFIAVLKGTRSRMVSAYLKEFDEAIEALDQSKAYPFRISVPYGISVSTKKRSIPVDDAVKLADERMYDAKLKSKEKLKAEDEAHGVQDGGYHDDRED